MLSIFTYTKGTGSGHLTRINAVYKGFLRAGIKCKFYASAYRSKYLKFLEPGIILCEKGKFPNKIDVFICDWRSDNFVSKFPKTLAKTWIGLRRLGKMKAVFPKYYHVVAIEPGAKGDVCIWPIINVWPDELISKKKLKSILKIKNDRKIALLCENGAYPKHIDSVFNVKVSKDIHPYRISNSPFAEGKRDFSYYNVAKFFKAADYLVIGGGYNSVHEALSYADMNKTTIINVGGDDQALRIKNLVKWERGKGSQAEVLAKYIVKYHKNKK